MLSLKEDKCRITAIIAQTLEREIQQLASEERRTKSAMVALLLEEAMARRNPKEEDM